MVGTQSAIEQITQNSYLELLVAGFGFQFTHCGGWSSVKRIDNEGEQKKFKKRCATNFTKPKVTASLKV